MTGKHCTKEELPSRAGNSHVIGFVTLVLTILVVGGGIVKNMDQRRQIARIDKEIARVEKEIEEIKPLLKNKQIYLESLKNNNVVAFARQMKMISPQPGQVCIVNEDDIAIRDVMVAVNEKPVNNGSMATAMTMPGNFR